MIQMLERHLIDDLIEYLMCIKLTFIDLFCGCGGFTLGMLRAGFECKAAIDFNHEAVETLKKNLQSDLPGKLGLAPVAHALEKDLTKFPPAQLEAVIGTRAIDVIVGGPPCQGFSTARQRDGSNHGTERLKDDPRRHLYRQFLDYVEYFQPKVFVIENVLGIRTAAGGKYFTAVQHEARILGHDKNLPGYRVHAQIEKAEDLGVPQKRRRQLIVGVRADLPGYFPPNLTPAPGANADTKLGDAICDLPTLEAGEGENVTGYDYAKRSRHLRGERKSIRRKYLFEVLQVDKAGNNLANHVARPHNARDIGDFKKLKEGQSSADAMRKGVEFDFPYDKTTFKDRYTRQNRDNLCSTIVAHLAKDGLMFIHPTQNRSFTPREAARVQSFPDWFVFPPARTHSFRLIGNAVPPLIGESVGLTINNFIKSNITIIRPSKSDAEIHLKRSLIQLPANDSEATRWLEPFIHVDSMAMRAMATETFLQGWHAFLCLFPDLHPQNALEHGLDKYAWPSPRHEFNLRYTRSGWPVALEIFGCEAWRRFEEAEFSDDLFYYIPAQRAGIKLRDNPMRNLMTE
jgi:DNA (cytosine-5)-methyltransferase 1